MSEYQDIGEKDVSRENGWRKIKSAPRDGTHIDLRLYIYASPRSMGMSDSFIVPDCHFEDEHWCHAYRGNPAEPLFDDYVTHWKVRK